MVVLGAGYTISPPLTLSWFRYLPISPFSPVARDAGEAPQKRDSWAFAGRERIFATAIAWTASTARNVGRQPTMSRFSCSQRFAPSRKADKHFGTQREVEYVFVQ
jgi:hypothetical protein